MAALTSIAQLCLLERTPSPGETPHAALNARDSAAVLPWPTPWRDPIQGLAPQQGLLLRQSDPVLRQVSRGRPADHLEKNLSEAAAGREAGASADEMSTAQAGRSEDAKTAAALTFALKVVEHRAAIDADDVQTLRNAGFDDEGIVELLAHVALNLFTNYVNVALDVPVDFPKAALRQAA